MLPYTIILGKSIKAIVEIHLDPPSPAAIPAFVSFGVGNKKKRYTDWLSTCFTSNTRLLNFLAYIHRLGKEKQCIALVAKGQLGNMQAQCVKDFLNFNAEMLDIILPYIFNDIKQMTDKIPEAPTIPAPLVKHLDDIQKLPIDDLLHTFELEFNKEVKSQ